MASDQRVLLKARPCLASALLGAIALIGGPQSLAAETLPYERPCPLLASPGNTADPTLMQPMRIRPQQVKAKNAMGCLSPSDAIYGPDGCPLRFCGPNSGTFQFR